MTPDEATQALAEQENEQEKRYTALGRLVDAASYLDSHLRTVLCALLGSKYAAVIVAGLMTGDLLEYIEAIVKVHREMGSDNQAKFLDLVRKARAASRERNRLVHDLWGMSVNGETALMQSVRRKHQYTIRTVTTEQIVRTSNELAYAGLMLQRAAGEVLGWDATTIEAQLRWEDLLAQQTPAQRAEMVERRQKLMERAIEEVESE